MMSPDRIQIISIIEEAFDGVPQPQEITLHVAEAHDSYDYDHDDEHRQKDHTGRWQDIPTAHIRSCQCALSFVDKVGMRFYLPAYMNWYLRNFETDEIRTDHTLYSLDNHADNPALAKYHIERFSLFSPDQLRACAMFVKCCADDETDSSDAHFAKKIYARYWAQHENS